MRTVCAPYLVRVAATPLALAALLISGCNTPGTDAPSTSPASEPELVTEDDKTIYAIGLSISQNLEGFGWTPEEVELIKLGLADGLLHREHKVDVAAYQGQMQQLAQTRMAARAEGEAKKGQEFLEQAAQEPGVETLDSGILVQHVTVGSGASPGPTSTVRVHYHGTLIDGTVFDSSVDRGEPIEFPLNRVIPCWTEGVQLMKVGGKAKLVCPSDKAYGDQGSPPTIAPGATLIFDVELLDIVE